MFAFLASCLARGVWRDGDADFVFLHGKHIGGSNLRSNIQYMIPSGMMVYGGVCMSRLSLSQSAFFSIMELETGSV
jgi:hypothetical protein